MADKPKNLIEKHGANFDEIYHPRQRAFLAAYCVCGTITRAADFAGICAVTHRNWLLNNPDYAKAFERAKQIFADRLECEILERALHGWEEPVIHHGKLCTYIDNATGKERPLTVRKKSDRLLMFAAKALLPEKYRDRFDINTNVRNVDRAEIEKLRETLRALQEDEEVAKALEVLGKKIDAIGDKQPALPQKRSGLNGKGKIGGNGKH